MPDYQRLPLPFAATGMDLRHPTDRLPQGKFAALINTRINVISAISGRYGMTPQWTTPISGDPTLHSLLCLYDPTQSSWTLLAGATTDLYYGQTSPTSAATGFSGNPLTFRLNWENPFTSHGMEGFLHIRDGYLTYLATAPVTLTLTYDQGAPIVITLPATSATQPQRVYWIPLASKGKLVAYSLASASAFGVFGRDSGCYVKPWGSTGPYQEVRPFPSQ